MYEDLNSVEIGNKAEESLIKSEVRNAFESLEDIRRKLNNMNREIVDYVYLDINS